MPEADFSAEGILAAAQKHLPKTARILRLRSDAAGQTQTAALRQRFATVDEFVICRNEPVRCEYAPPCDAVFLASPSACNSLAGQFGTEYMRSKKLVAIGSKTAGRLKELGLTPACTARKSTVKDALAEWAHRTLLQTMETEVAS
jgi:uroporphyrinogen-III synthase